MAYGDASNPSANFRALVNGPPGRLIYRWDTQDAAAVVELAGYFNNSDDNLNLAEGDLIHVIVWDGTPHDAAQTPTGYSLQIVTTVDPAGVVNTAEAGISTSAALSST